MNGQGTLRSFRRYQNREAGEGIMAEANQTSLIKTTEARRFCSSGMPTSQLGLRHLGWGLGLKILGNKP